MCFFFACLGVSASEGSVVSSLFFWRSGWCRRAFRCIFFRYRSKRMPLQSLTHAAGRCERRSFHAVPAETSLPRRQKAQCSMFNVQCSMFNVQGSRFPPTILINKVCFPFAHLCVSASEGTVVVRPVPRGPRGPRMRRSRLLPVSCAFLRFFCRNPSHDAGQCRSVFPQKVRICDIFRGFPARSGPAGWVFQTGNRRSGAFFHVFLSCNRLSFSAEGKK